MDTNIAERLLRETDDFRDARHLVDVEGMSSPKVCSFLNRLVATMDPHEHYLEVGTWKGRTLLSAAMGNTDRVCFACDKFRLWGRFTGFGHVAKRALLGNIARYRDQGAKIRLFDTTSRRLFAEHKVPAPVGVYFYDGGHSLEETREGIASAAPLLSRRAVVLVDDYNDEAVRRGAMRGFADADLKVLWSRFLPGTHDERDFWDGLGVFYVER
jgi:hypothetical protein